MNNSFEKINIRKQKLMAGFISLVIIVAIVITVYIFFIKVLESDNNQEVKYLSLTDSKVVDLWDKINHFSDWYNPEVEPEYEAFIEEFYGLDKKTVEDFSNELQQFLGISSKLKYEDLEFKTVDGIETAEIGIPDFRDSMNALFGTSGEIEFIPFNSGKCHFGNFETIENSLMLNVTRDNSGCDNANSNFMVELVTALEEDSNIIFEVQTGFVFINDDIPVLYTNSEKVGQVSSSIAEFEDNGFYNRALTTYKNNLNLYKIVFSYTGTNYRFNSIERTK